MPYRDGRYTACISSQAGCAMGCVFCATGQMGFARQLTSDEILEQVARFDTELDAVRGRIVVIRNGGLTRLSNIVFMGMGEPLANYRNVKEAIHRITQDLGIGARKITVSTVGVVPNIRKLFSDPDMPQVRLAVSLHCASDAERTKLLPANARYGGLDELMLTLKEYIETTNRRITLEWALIRRPE
jgi:23S rRNA (adenine2503-C2)-methyltransferase